MEYKNRKLADIRLDDDVYKLVVPLGKNFLEKWEAFNFFLDQKSRLKKMDIPYELLEETEEYLIFELYISNQLLEIFDEDETILPKVFLKREEEEKSVTIKSNNDYFELLQQHINGEQIRYPFTTKNDNIAFKTEREELFARVDYAEINENDEIELYGLYHFGDLQPEDIARLELVVMNNKTEQEHIYPAELTTLPDMYKDRQWAAKIMNNGFHVKFDTHLLIKEARPSSYSFFVRLLLDESDESLFMQSSRVTFNANSESAQPKKIYSYAHAKFLISITPTKKRKYFSVRASYYQPVMRVLRLGKQKVVHARRSKRMLKFYRFVFRVMAKMNPQKEKLVIFESFHGKQYSDNPRAIYEYMNRHTKGYRLIWSADRRHLNKFVEAGVPHVQRFSFKWLYLMTGAAQWVTNTRLPLWIPKPKHTEYLQTWHGTPLKRLAADMDEVHMPGTDTERYKRNFTTEAAKWDYLVSPNEYSSEIFSRAFQFDKEMLETGYPRNDYLYTKNNSYTIGRIKKRIGIDADKKVILYAPTWRDNQFYRKGAYKFDLQMDLDELQREFGETHVIVLRMHYLVAENLDISEYEGFVYDCSTYDDIRDLYLIADTLITDYSSVFFDYANLRRPMIFFVYDIEEYRDTLRGFYFDFEEKAPGPLVKTTEGLVQELKKIEQDGFQPNNVYDEFIDKFCYLEDGHASERVVKAVFEN